MIGDAHIHIALGAEGWAAAAREHAARPNEARIAQRLRDYQAMGVRFLRDGGDRWGVSARAAQMADAYGIDYRTPLFPIYKTGHYGSFLGCGFQTMEEFRTLCRQVRDGGGHFIKIMASDLMDFSRFGRCCGPGLDRRELTQMTAYCHDLGFSVMAHCNGAQTCRAAVLAGVDSLEHGGYLDEETAVEMVERGIIWVPTLSPIGNQIGAGRYPDEVQEKILSNQLALVRFVFERGGRIGLGSDAGAGAVAHGAGIRSEYRYLSRAIAPEKLDAHLSAVQTLLRERFRPQW